MALSPMRQMVYDFLSLPWHTQVEMLRSLGINTGDNGLHDEQGWLTLMFRQVREAGKVNELTELVRAAGQETDQ